MSRFIDISGKKFNRLTAINFVYRSGSKYFWNFKCECGKKIISEKYKVMSGKKVSCGCYKKEINGKEKIKINCGDVFGKLTVLNCAYIKQKEKYYRCKCFCGKYCIKSKKYLLYAPTCSCGCLKSEISQRQQLINCKKHGLSKTNLYRRWYNIKQRCFNPKNNSYKNYGGRKITICKEWLGINGFLNFYNWSIKNGYNEKDSRRFCTIDRIDVNGNYCPENCRWVSMKTQNNNKRNNHLITINNETKTLTEWINRYNISSSAYYYRKQKGMSDLAALTTPTK